MIDRFNDLLKSSSKLLKWSLHTDRNNACAIQIHKGVIVQLQTDASQEKLLIASKVAELPAGKFRENVIKEALKANGTEDPRVGLFAYLAHTNHLVLFQRYPFDLLTPERLVALLGSFIETVEHWHNAIAAGLHSPPPLKPTSNPFGLRS